MATLFDDLSASTRAAWAARVVYDNLFVQSGLQRLARVLCTEEPYEGGLYDTVPYIFDRPAGGASVPAKTRTVVDKQLIAGMMFQPKEYTIDIPENEWRLKALNRGDNAIISLYDTWMKLAVEAFNTEWTVDAWGHGQTSSSTVSQDNSIRVQGFDEFYNDGVNPGWMGNTYTTIGSETRNQAGTNTNTLNSVPVWCGDAAGAVGQVNYSKLLDGYLQCVEDPDVGLCSRELFRLILTRLEPKQGFAQETDVRIGVEGVKLLNAKIHKDLLAPSTKYGSMLSPNLTPGRTLVPSDIAVGALTAAQTAVSGYPENTTCKAGEPFFWVRLRDWVFRPLADPRYRHHFEGPIPSPEAPDLKVMFYQEGLNWYTPFPRNGKIMVGFGS